MKKQAYILFDDDKRLGIATSEPAAAAMAQAKAAERGSAVWYTTGDEFGDETGGEIVRRYAWASLADHEAAVKAQEVKP